MLREQVKENKLKVDAFHPQGGCPDELIRNLERENKALRQERAEFQHQINQFLQAPQDELPHHRNTSSDSVKLED